MDGRGDTEQETDMSDEAIKRENKVMRDKEMHAREIKQKRSEVKRKQMKMKSKKEEEERGGDCAAK